MKKFIVIIIVLSTLLLVGCQNKVRDTQNQKTTKEIIKVSNDIDYSDNQNDLVYYDYGTGIELSANTKVIIPQLVLGLKNETAFIYAVNLTTNEVIQLSDYQPMQDITFATNSDGIFRIIADISTGHIIDLTQKVSIGAIGTSYEEKSSHILLP